jgi:hypothetical protein
MNPELIRAILGEVSALAIRFYFLNQSLDQLAGMTPEESKARFDAALVEFENRPSDALRSLIS